MTFNDFIYLRRTFTPYIGQSVILFLVTVMALYVSWSNGTWGLFLTMPVGWIFFGIFVYIGSLYKIYYSAEEICRQASGGPNRCIKIDQIAKIEMERASVNEMVAQSSPLRRIKISDGNGVYINVSIRHFRDEDVRCMMSIIHKRRPNLEMPKVYAR